MFYPRKNWLLRSSWLAVAVWATALGSVGIVYSANARIRDFR